MVSDSALYHIPNTFWNEIFSSYSDIPFCSLKARGTDSVHTVPFNSLGTGSSGCRAPLPGDVIPLETSAGFPKDLGAGSEAAPSVGCEQLNAKNPSAQPTPDLDIRRKPFFSWLLLFGFLKWNVWLWPSLLLELV